MSHRWYVKLMIRLGWAVVRGLSLYGAAVTGTRAYDPRPPQPTGAHPRRPELPAGVTPPAAAGPPAGHPERAAAHVQPSATEVLLWRQLLPDSDR